MLKKIILGLALFLAILTAAGCLNACTQNIKGQDKLNSATTKSPEKSFIPQVIENFTIDNPYELVKWNETTQYKANFHTHTTMSDGSETPQNVVNFYANKDFKILSITDHNYYNIEGTETLPWSELSDVTNSQNLISIPGCEVTSSQDINSLFSRMKYIAPITTVDEAIQIGQNAGAVLNINHPGRYNTPTQTYVELYKKYSALVSMEILNGQNMGEGDPVKIWDDVLYSLMPERAVWASGGDDYHCGDPAEKVGKYFNIMLLNKDNLKDDQIEKAYRSGQYFVGATNDARYYQLPVIKSIDVNQDKGKITILVEGCKKVTWISGETRESQETDLSSCTLILDVGALMRQGKIAKYVRVVFENDQGQVYSQPFGLILNK